MDEFHERGNQSLQGSLKRASLWLFCPKERLFDKEEDLVYLCSVLAETGIYLLFLGCKRSRREDQLAV